MNHLQINGKFEKPINFKLDEEAYKWRRGHGGGMKHAQIGILGTKVELYPNNWTILCYKDEDILKIGPIIKCITSIMPEEEKPNKNFLEWLNDKLSQIEPSLRSWKDSLNEDVFSHW